MWDWAISSRLNCRVFGGGCDIFSGDLKHFAYLCCYSQSFFHWILSVISSILATIFRDVYFFLGQVIRPGRCLWSCTALLYYVCRLPALRPFILRLCRVHFEQIIADVLASVSSVKTAIYFIFVSIQFWYLLRFALQIITCPIRASIFSWHSKMLARLWCLLAPGHRASGYVAPCVTQRLIFT